MKATIMIFALSRSPWIGGIYYRRNIIHMLLTNKNIVRKYKIVVLTNDKYRNVFEVFNNQVEILCCKDDIGVATAIYYAVRCCVKNKVKYVFPLRPFGFLKLFGITPVSWIADFQHCHYPEFFGEEEIQKRDWDFRQIAKAGTPLVLSSEDAVRDFQTYYAPDRKNVFVVHFASYIEDELQRLDAAKERRILETYGLYEEKYAVICNQFWKHKNHIVVLEAIKELKRNSPEINIRFVFTGELSDRRNPEYIDEIKTLMNNDTIKNSVKLLGFVDRASQLCIMKNAEFLIQPSLFEGWGTVVEDAKVLNMRMILSDIAVHREQMNAGCILFEKDDSEDLARAINEMLAKNDTCTETDCDLSGQYAKVLEKIFK